MPLPSRSLDPVRPARSRSTRAFVIDDFLQGRPGRGFGGGGEEAASATLVRLGLSVGRGVVQGEGPERFEGLEIG